MHDHSHKHFFFSHKASSYYKVIEHSISYLATLPPAEVVKARALQVIQQAMAACSTVHYTGILYSPCFEVTLITTVTMHNVNMHFLPNGNLRTDY